ncbi:cilia- and flagella-associated protein 251 isoform X2 [Xenopus laevis]|uniref:Cilia- and flagella-associated protein 251 n=1 Tax=Xenopus laevis TaxID=8355 RepID=A0A8J0VAR4_XENLA|nr:cilia- and flagella-associated protein 251 isoform X2 [Xenopus laevis]
MLMSINSMDPHLGITANEGLSQAGTEETQELETGSISNNEEMSQQVVGPEEATDGHLDPSEEEESSQNPSHVYSPEQRLNGGHEQESTKMEMESTSSRTFTIDDQEQDLHGKQESPVEKMHELSDDMNGKEQAKEVVADMVQERHIESAKGEDSLVYTAIPVTLFEDANAPSADKPLNLAWSFGLNSNIPVFNFYDEARQVIVYACAHTAVIQDISQNRQHHLQGHCSCISCMCVSEDRRWIATADRGSESLIIIWDSFSGIPVHTIFDSHPEGGVIAMCFSQNAKYLATVGGANVQRVCIWEWTTDTGKPICSAELSPEFGVQTYIVFNANDQTQLVTNGEKQVIFYTWTQNSLDYEAPPLNDTTFNKVVGEFSQSVFDFSATRALTGTAAGKLVVWETSHSPSIKATSSIQPHKKKALKLMHLQKDAITVLSAHDRYFITGDVQGHIKFYDQRLQLVNWYSHLTLKPIRSISFSTCPPVSASGRTRYPQDCSIKGDQFAISDFIVSTLDSVVLHVHTDGTMLKKHLQEPSKAVHALACHPHEHLIAIGSYDGLLKVWNYKTRNLFISRIFGKGKSVRCLSYDPKGFLLGAGFTDGSVYILDAMTLEDEIAEPFKYARGSITHISFSHDSQYLATADTEFTVTLFKLSQEKDGLTWQYFGRYRSHYKAIQNLMFGIHLDTNEPRLISLGMDRMLVEYDLANSAKCHLLIHSNDRIEQSAVPQSLAWYPPVTKESFILVANDHYKMKLYNATTKMCRKTLLGPTFGSPVRKMEVLPTESEDICKGFMAYITDDKVGLQILPLDGNPHKSMSLICHPDGVSNLACSYDGCFVFTAGGDDCTVLMWKTNLQALEAVASLGGDGLIPFYGLLQGGQDGLLFKELENYFYYAQLRHQGIDTMETRQVSTHIPLKEVPFIMRALGYYPSEQEVENMLNEIKFSEYVDTGKQVSCISLEELIKLYINHRPAFGLFMEELQWAFQVLGFTSDNEKQAINRRNLLQLLQSRGEHLTEEEIAEYLSTLLGLNPEGGSSEIGAADLLEQEIPEEITTDFFAADILGLPYQVNGLYEEHTVTQETDSS